MWRKSLGEVAVLKVPQPNLKLYLLLDHHQQAKAQAEREMHRKETILTKVQDQSQYPQGVTERGPLTTSEIRARAKGLVNRSPLGKERGNNSGRQSVREAREVSIHTEMNETMLITGPPLSRPRIGLMPHALCTAAVPKVPQLVAADTERHPTQGGHTASMDVTTLAVPKVPQTIVTGTLATTGIAGVHAMRGIAISDDQGHPTQPRSRGSAGIPPAAAERKRRGHRASRLACDG